MKSVAVELSAALDSFVEKRDAEAQKESSCQTGMPLGKIPVRRWTPKTEATTFIHSPLLFHASHYSLTFYFCEGTVLPFFMFSQSTPSRGQLSPHNPP